MKDKLTRLKMFALKEFCIRLESSCLRGFGSIFNQTYFLATVGVQNCEGVASWQSFIACLSRKFAYI
jgi:hypothetical protein